MAYEASDGKKFTNKPAMRAHSAYAQSRGMSNGAQGRMDPLGTPGTTTAEGEDQGGEAPEQVAEAHGPAHEVHMMHDHEGGMHRVHSKHPDGHEHHSEHGSADEAHEHASKLAGCGMGG